MSSDTQNPGGWPDAARPGVPANPERDGWHWLSGVTERPAAFEWRSASGGWLFHRAQHNVMPPSDFANWLYHGPCLTPAEVAAREAAARREGIEAAASRCDTREVGWGGICGYREQEAADCAAAIRALLEDGR